MIYIIYRIKIIKLYLVDSDSYGKYLLISQPDSLRYWINCTWKDGIEQQAKGPMRLPAMLDSETNQNYFSPAVLHLDNRRFINYEFFSSDPSAFQ